MSRILIIGMPVGLRARFEAAARTHSVDATLVLAAPGKTGQLELRPFPGQAAADFEEYLNGLPDWSQGYVVILPYAELPSELDHLVLMVEEQGGTVVQPAPGGEGWPKAPRAKAPDQFFYDTLLRQLAEALFPLDDATSCDLPSVSLRAALGQHDRLVAAQHLFDHCDGVAPLRYQFVADALAAFLHIVANGTGGRTDAFFGSRGLLHAQSGGLVVNVEVWCVGKMLKTFSTQTHISSGQNTTAASAARIYYCSFQLQKYKYIGLLYIGAHPDGQLNCWIDLPEGSPGTAQEN